jgi:hypothetical protein
MKLIVAFRNFANAPKTTVVFITTRNKFAVHSERCSVKSDMQSYSFTQTSGHCERGEKSRVSGLLTQWGSLEEGILAL